MKTSFKVALALILATAACLEPVPAFDASSPSGAGLDAGGTVGAADATSHGGPADGGSPRDAGTLKGEVSCGATVCTSAQLCLVCGAGASPSCVARRDAGGATLCADKNQFALNVLCDDDGDCAPGERCRLLPGDLAETLECSTVDWHRGHSCTGAADCGDGGTCSPIHDTPEFKVCR